MSSLLYDQIGVRHAKTTTMGDPFRHIPKNDRDIESRDRSPAGPDHSQPSNRSRQRRVRSAVASTCVRYQIAQPTLAAPIARISAPTELMRE
jgi:hypothetical protein